MGLIANIAGAVRAGLDMVQQDQEDTIVALENERDRLNMENGVLRDELAAAHERLERAALHERSVVSRYGGQPGESLEVFVARVVDHGTVAAVEVERLRVRVRELEAIDLAEVTKEWDRAASEAEKPRAVEQCCGTCAAFRRDDPERQPGASGLCNDLLAIHQSGILASIYNGRVRPRACPGWRRR